MLEVIYYRFLIKAIKIIYFSYYLYFKRWNGEKNTYKNPENLIVRKNFIVNISLYGYIT